MCDSTLKVGNKLLLHKLKRSILSTNEVLGRAILIGEIITHKFIKIVFRYCQFQVWWRSSDDKIYYETYTKDLPSII